jgi:ubiquinone/menaquinone biosynthesis C-methylase UbiE
MFARDTSAEPEDYRTSHEKRGPSYDSTLGSTPFDAYMAQWESRWLQRIAHGLSGARIGRYLDFACGTARITHVLASRAEESVGVDISASMLEIARKKCPGTRFVQADLTRDHVDIGTFDLVTSFRFLGNAQNDLRKESISVMCSLLRPGGHLVVNNHRNPLALGTLLYGATGGVHKMDLTYFKLRRLLSENRLSIVRTVPIGFWLFRSSMQARPRAYLADRTWEAMFSSRLFTPFAPDMIVVARKT